MTVLTQGIQTGEWLLSYAPGERSKSLATVTIAGSVALPSGTVLGRVLTGTAAAAAKAGNTGNGTMGAITVTGSAKAGAYKLTVQEPASNAGSFVVEDPDGLIVSTGNVAAAYSAGGLAFTLADGSTDFVSGDQFTITVTATAIKHVKYDNAGSNGAETAVAVLWNALPGTNGDHPATVFDCDCEVVNAMLNGGDGLDAPGKADLLKVGIKVR